MSASRSARRPTIVPSRRAPISTCWTCPRPWVRPSMLSERVSTHRTGRPASIAGLGHRQVLGVDLQLRAEPTTDVGRDRAHLRLLEPERLGEVVADVERDLGRDPHGEPAVAARAPRRSRSSPSARARVVGSRTVPRPRRRRPTSTSSSQSVSKAFATFVPCAGQSSGSRRRPPRAPRRSPRRAARTRAGRPLGGVLAGRQRLGEDQPRSAPPRTAPCRARATSRPNTPSRVPLAPSTLPLGGIGGSDRSTAA